MGYTKQLVARREQGSDAMGYDGAHEALNTDEDVVDAHFKLILVLLRQEGPYVLPSDGSYADPEITSWAAEARSVCHYALEGHCDQDYLVGRLEELGGYISPYKICVDCKRELTEAELQCASETGEANSPLCDGCAASSWESDVVAVPACMEEYQKAGERMRAMAKTPDEKLSEAEVKLFDERYRDAKLGGKR